MKNELVEQQESDEEKQKKSSNTSQGEKLFWGILISGIILMLIVTLIARNRTQNNYHVETQKELVSKEIIKYIMTDKMRDNLAKNEVKINKNLNLGLERTYYEIEKEIESLFYPIEKNVDSFLDYHYSIKGEYIELGTMAFGDINKLIEKKLLNEDFTQRIEQSSKYIQEQYEVEIQKHFVVIDQQATEDVDVNTNREVLNKLQESVKTNQIRLSIQATAPLGAVMGVKIASVISAKISVKAVAKGVTKASSKLAAKSIAAGTGATAGAFCGPFFWVCSPLAAGALWFTTDAAVVTGDEYFTRDQLKKEILMSLQESKQKLKDSYKEAYYQSFTKFSKDVQEEYKNTPILKKTLIKDNFS